MNSFETISATQAYRQPCEDCVAVFSDESRTVIVVADGAGGIGNGERAAQSVVSETKAAYSQIHSADEWASLLRQVDCRISDGESTAVVLDIRTYGIAGASVGDSRAVLIHDGKLHDLTSQQKRKPLLGSGAAEPIGFQHSPLAGVLLVGTDGFFNYADEDSIIRIVSSCDFHSLPRRCIEAVRLPSGEYWDDIGLVAVRKRRQWTARRTYEIATGD
jgi:serine/threonine protein phosphatase PrpC